MSVLTSLGILFLSMLIMASLQLTPGVFLLLNHYAHGRFSKPRASDLTVFFILGTETITVLIFLLIYLISSNSLFLLPFLNSSIFSWIMIGILIALSILIPCFYYRKGSGTELFISRQLANTYREKAKTAKSRSDAFMLGIFTMLPELAFTLPLFIICALEITKISPDSFSHAGLIILFAIAAILPLLIVHSLSATGHNLADFTKFRFHNKNFFRFGLSLLYILIAILMLVEVLL